jgi:hypothetical protein
MTEKLFDQISNRVDRIENKIEFFNELEMRIDSALNQLVEDEEEEEEDDSFPSIRLEELVSNTNITYTE